MQPEDGFHKSYAKIIGRIKNQTFRLLINDKSVPRAMVLNQPEPMHTQSGWLRILLNYSEKEAVL